jgi:hypothetical protein
LYSRKVQWPIHLIVYRYNFPYMILILASP